MNLDLLNILFYGDGHRLAQGVAQAAAFSHEIRVVSCSAELEYYLTKYCPDIAFINLPGSLRDQLEAIERLQRIYPFGIVVSLHADSSTSSRVQAYDRGASVCLSSTQSPEELLAAALAQLRWIPEKSRVAELLSIRAMLKKSPLDVASG